MARPLGRLLFVIIGRILLLVVVLLLALRIFAPSIIVNQVNKQLANTLSPSARLDKVRLGLLRGFAGISGLQISQPKGFGEDDFFSLGSLSVDVQPMTATKHPLVIEQIALDKITLHLVMANDEQGQPQLNATMLAPRTETPAEPKPEQTAEPTPFSLWLQALNADGISIRFTDRTRDPEWTIAIHKLSLAVKDLRFSTTGYPEGTTHAPARIELSAEILQPSGIHAQLRIIMQLAAIGKTPIPSLTGSLQLVGIDLDLFAPFLVPGAKTAFQGEGFDLAVDFRVGETLLDVKAGVITNKNHPWPIEVSGTIDEPKFDAGGLFGSVFMIPGRMLGSAVENVGDAAVATAQAAADTTATAIKGGVKTVGRLAGGIGDTLRSAVTLDVGGVVSNVTATAVDTVGEAAKTVMDTGETAAQGVATAGGKLAGISEKSDSPWWNEVSARTTEAEKRARDFVESAAIP